MTFEEIERREAAIKRIKHDSDAAKAKLRLIRKISESSLPVEKKSELVHRLLAGGAQ